MAPDKSLAYIDWALHEMCPDILEVIPRRKRKSDTDQLRGIKGIGKGAPVIYLTSDLGDVPALPLALASGIYRIHHVDALSVREVLQRCTRGRIPANYAPDLTGVAMPIVAAAIASGSTAKKAMVTLDRLSRASKLEGVLQRYREPLLVMLDGGEEGNDGVVIIGATNRPEVVDPAIRRPGRLNKTIAMPLPDARAREHIIKTHLRGQLASVSLYEIVQRLAGASAADLMQVVREARVAARKEGAELDLRHFDQVCPAREPSSSIQRRIAVHEAGHAACAVLLNDENIKLLSVTTKGLTGGQATLHQFVATIDQPVPFVLGDKWCSFRYSNGCC